MSRFTAIRIFLAKTFWPFFTKYIWPIIQDEVVAVVKTTFRYLRDLYEQILNDSNKRREEQARARAQEAEEKAKTAKDEAEAGKYKAISEVWHQVAEEFRIENELLKKEFAKVSENVSQEAEDRIRSIQIDIKDKQPQLISGDKTIALPVPPDKSPDLPIGDK